MVALFLALLLALPAGAVFLEDELGIDDLGGAAERYMEGYLSWEQAFTGDLSDGLSSVLVSGERTGILMLRQALGQGLILFAVVLLGSLAETLHPAPDAGIDPVRLATTVCVAVVALGDVNTLMGLGKETLEKMSDFSLLLLPVMTAASAASGSPAASVVRQGATLLFFDLLLELVRRIILPLILAYCAALIAYAALGNDGLKRVAGVIKWCATGLLTLLLSGFVLYLTVTGAVAGNADALAQKAAKTALSGMVPVVGGILSDAAETVVAGAGVVKGSLGVAGLLVILCICLAPFLRLGCHYLVYKLVAALASLVTTGPAANLLDTLSAAFALLLGAVAGGGLILYISLIASLQLRFPA